MSIASLIGGAFVVGIILYVIFFFAWAYGGRKIFFRFWYRKHIQKARKVLDEIDSQYPRDTKDKKLRTEREILLGKSGFNKFTLDIADKLNQKERIKNGSRTESSTGTSEGKGKGKKTSGTGTNKRGTGTRDVATESKRVLPPSKTSTDEPTDQPSKWDWSSFSKNR